MKNKKANRFTFDSRIDYGLILPAFMLILIGLYALYVAVSHDHPTQATTMVVQQGTWVIVGLFVALIVMHMDSRFLWNLTPFFYVLGLILMILPIFFYDKATYASTGAKNWLAFGGRNLFQPSEFMKLSYILFSARIVVTFQNNLKKRVLKDDFRLIGLLILETMPVAIISVFQKDFGTFLVFIAILAGIILVSGISWKILAPAFLFVAAVAGGIVALVASPEGQKFLESTSFAQYQVNRFIAWLHPFEYSQTFSLQQARSLISVGVGGLWGKGIGVANVNVPVRESDMIFTVIAEDFGFVGSAFLIFLYFMLIYRMIRVTFKSNNQFYTYISTGIIMMILFHVFENIGAAIGVVPLTGIPLPFISQGGSALMANIIGLGLVLSMKYNQLPEFVKEQRQIPVKGDSRKNRRRNRR
ncbi:MULTISPECIES: FtsW/RodA/SpoVE family cell cycle protein [Lactococcus]|uniref:FtsW/RodA/SpoVE family cell cycle protein n=2 Tax=Lactococcus lactis TaxID=1358 RepID=A0A552Z5X5_9LACT|nr:MULTISPECIES: FtsW/RodA/SpoVE family cell cycle protein [Lactococcus]AUS69369.1 FtsW/RodA/SpoVE family cell cycle protein [Lactococcus lactis subsp. lactis]AWN65461.1 FtsW/RodA/SpoVE family cell cycle protein [Lactococcus lactis subsp. lactis]KGF76859.1 Cell division protein FtsW [Lactococcus lactis]KSU01213.1 Cell division protein FtsW [Lactococcus lactis subsp. lactis]MBK0028488.1 FtsW/RodA/SpoVE family cell cycle protein [Lactococcus sp. S47]